MTAPVWQRRQSGHVAVRDGTRLAVHLFHPAAGDGQRPLLWVQDRYHTVREIAAPSAPAAPHRVWLAALVERGYAIALVDTRGSGASFGTSRGPFAPEERRDAYDMTEWFAGQSWCDGRVGMVGRSYAGIAQYLAASTRPPHLVALFAEMAMGDLYGFAHSGGIFRHDFARQWARRVRDLDSARDAIGVDGDRERDLLRAAQREHGENRDVHEMFAGLPYRDSRDADGSLPYEERSPFAQRTAIAASQIPICHLAGWLDMWVRDAILWWQNLANPQRLVIGPWPHGGGIGEALAAEQDDWFRAAAAARGKEIRYHTGRPGAAGAWRESSAWPPPGASAWILHLAAGRSGTIRSQNDGVLIDQPAALAGAERMVIDPDASSGRTSRWTNGYGGEFAYGDMTGNERRGLTYTTPPLAAPVELTGHPLLRVWLSAAEPDADLFAYLSLVHPDGGSEYLTEGCLRASHRQLARPDFDALELPYHRSRAADLMTGLAEPVELTFDLLPVSVLVPAGMRLRLALAGADRDNALGLSRAPGSSFLVHRGPHLPSRLQLAVAGAPGRLEA